MINLLKILKQKINELKSQKYLLTNVQVGDLVWSKMPFSKKELDKIEQSHRIRPYIVIKKDMLNIYAFQSSSKSSTRLNNIQEYKLHKGYYMQNRDSYINLTQVYKIPFYKLKEKSNKINSFDLNNIEKRLFAQNVKSEYKFNINIYISEGDVIVFDGQLYYVYASDNTYVYCFSIFKKQPKDEDMYISITINKKRYYTIFKNKRKFNKTTNFKIVNIAYESELKEIINKKKEIDFMQKNLNKIKKEKNVIKEPQERNCF